MNKNISSADITIYLTIEGVFSTYQKLVGFAPDSAVDFREQQTGVTVTGVDGNMVAGHIPSSTDMMISIMPDSSSILIFEAWFAAQKISGNIYYAYGAMSSPSLQTGWTLMKGALTGYQHSSAKRTMQPINVTITWQSVYSAPI